MSYYDDYDEYPNLNLSEEDIKKWDMHPIEYWNKETILDVLRRHYKEEVAEAAKKYTTSDLMLLVVWAGIYHPFPYPGVEDPPVVYYGITACLPNANSLDEYINYEKEKLKWM